MIALIPAKQNSTRLKNKNLKLLNGKPLIFYSIKAALKSKYISRVIVSTDSKLIAKKSLNYGAEVPFIRPKSISKKATNLKHVCRHALKYLEKKENIKINDIVVLQPTSPLRTPNDIDNSIKIFKKNSKIKYLTSFAKTKPFEWFFKKKKNNIYFQISKKEIKNSQYLDQTFVLTGAIYIMKREVIFGEKIDLQKVTGIEIPQERSIDIDDENDFRLAKNLLLKNEK